jgi:hypothetical protein
MAWTCRGGVERGGPLRLPQGKRYLSFRQADRVVARLSCCVNVYKRYAKNDLCIVYTATPTKELE